MQVQTYSMDGTFLIKFLPVIAKAHQLKLLYEYFRKNVGACHILSQIRSSLYYSIFFISYFTPPNIGWALDLGLDPGKYTAWCFHLHSSTNIVLHQNKRWLDGDIFIHLYERLTNVKFVVMRFHCISICTHKLPKDTNEILLVILSQSITCLFLQNKMERIGSRLLPA